MRIWDGVQLSDTGREIVAIVDAGYPGRNNIYVTSGIRPGDPGYHGRGLAVDFGADSQGPKDDLANWLYQFYSVYLELIHTRADGGSGWYAKNGNSVSGSFYGPDTVQQHINHVHLAVDPSDLATFRRIAVGNTPQTSSPGASLTIYFPDLSEYNNVTVAAGTPAVFARATIGNSTDGKYQSYQQQAAAVGALFVGYHFLNAAGVGTGSAEQQAEFAHSVVGGVPLMLDAEPNRGGNATLDEMCRFIDRYRAVGGTVNVAYIPRWSWEQLGSPSLQALADRHISLVSSNYTSYSDTGPGWGPYGGLTPAVWQYTDAQGYGGGSADFNAFRGTIDQLRALVGDNVALTDEDKVFIRSQAIAVIQWISQGHDSLNPGGGAIGDDNAAVTLPAVKHKIEAIQASTGGLSDADRAAVKALTDAVNALNSRLSTP